MIFSMAFEIQDKFCGNSSTSEYLCFSYTFREMYKSKRLDQIGYHSFFFDTLKNINHQLLLNFSVFLKATKASVQSTDIVTPGATRPVYTESSMVEYGMRLTALKTSQVIKCVTTIRENFNMRGP